jgi:hypothetical protein
VLDDDGVIDLTPLEAEFCIPGDQPEVWYKSHAVSHCAGLLYSFLPTYQPITPQPQNHSKMSGVPALPQSLKESVENSKVEYVNLGKSGLRVSIPILGAMSIGHPEWAPWVIDEEKVYPTLRPESCRLLIP